MNADIKHSRALVITDNPFLREQFQAIATSHEIGGLFVYRSSPLDETLQSQHRQTDCCPLNIETDWPWITGNFDLVISLHCKQIFPPQLVRAVRCINVHPGLNPYNRGWYPQVFSIINKLPLGATIHEIDEKLDHGSIIAQEQVEVFSWDTSLTAYNRVIQAELRLIRDNLVHIARGDYYPLTVREEGNLNSRADFRHLCKLDLEERDTLRTFLDRLRALTHGDCHNAYFIDKAGKKVFVRIQLDPELH
jgi:methionyl-tRNA formyltransferase